MTQQNENLLNQLKNTPSDNLSKGVNKVDKLGEQDYEDATRAENHSLSKNFNKIKIYWHWILSVFGAALLAAFLIVIYMLLYEYIANVIATPAAVKNLLSNIWNTVLIVGTTLFIQKKFGK